MSTKYSTKMNKLPDLTISLARRTALCAHLCLTALLLAACSGDTSADTSAEADEICFHADVWQVMEGTRATTVNAGTVNGSFMVYAFYNATTNCYINGEEVMYSSGESSWVHRQYWPRDNRSLDFFALMPVALPSYYSFDAAPYNAESNPDGYSAGSPRIVCTNLPMNITDSSDSEELVFALTTGQSEKSQGTSGVTLTFKRPLARVKFQLSASHPDITINSITFKGLKSGGTCTFNGTTSSWSSFTPEGTVDFKVTLNQVCNSNSTNSPTQIGSSYLVVPQPFAGEITVNASWTDWGEQLSHNVSTTLPAPITWQPGYSYTYTFTITETDLIVDTQKYTEQW